MVEARLENCKLTTEHAALNDRLHRQVEELAEDNCALRKIVEVQDQENCALREELTAQDRALQETHTPNEVLRHQVEEAQKALTAQGGAFCPSARTVAYDSFPQHTSQWSQDPHQFSRDGVNECQTMPKHYELQVEGAQPVAAVLSKPRTSAGVLRRQVDQDGSFSSKQNS